MHAKTMEGLVGANTSANLLNTPMGVYKAAEARGDTAVMERALGYAGETAEQADRYRATADEGMKEDAKETKEKAEALREEALRKRKEEQAKLEQRIEESRQKDTDMDTDTVQISEAGRDSAPEPAVPESTAPADGGSASSASDAPAAEPVTYTSAGEVTPVQAEPGGNFSLTV